MELTRRDAVAALAAVGVGGSVGALQLNAEGDLWKSITEDDLWKSIMEDDLRKSITEDTAKETALSDEERETLNAVAAVVYPSEVSGIPEFVENYVAGRNSDREFAEGMSGAIEILDEHAEAWFDSSYRELSPSDQETVLRQMGLDDMGSVPDGSRPERVRYYLVNELLYALYTTPTGGELVGIENPPGHPGGTESYQTLRKPEAES